jgi:hypothetical protein
MSLIKFFGTIFNNLKDAHFSPRVENRVYVFDSRYDFYAPDKDQSETLMGYATLEGWFVVNEGYEFSDKLCGKLESLGINHKTDPVEPPEPLKAKQ